MDLMRSDLYVRSFFHILVDPIVSQERIANLIAESSQRLEGITKGIGVPTINPSDCRGLIELKDLSLFASSGLRKATSNFLSKVADSLKASLRGHFLEICRVDGRFVTDFTAFVRQVVPHRDLKSLINSGGDFGERELSLLAYAACQDPAGIQDKCKQIMALPVAAAEALMAAMLDYAEKFKRLAHFFMFEPWFDGHSLVDVLSAYWRQQFDFDQIEINIRPLGFPDAYYKDSWFDKIVELFEPLSENGKEVLSSLSTQRAKTLTTDLHATMNLEICGKNFTCRILSWDYLKGLGFFRSEPCVQIDPGIPILELVEILVHELMHYVYHNLTDANFFVHANALCRVDSPYLNEGFAEYHTEYGLRDVFKKYPELEFFRMVRRILLHCEDNRDSHVAGAALMHDFKDGRFSKKHQLMHRRHDFDRNRVENLNVTPKIKLAVERKKGKIEPKVNFVEIPTPGSIERMLSMVMASDLHCGKF